LPTRAAPDDVWIGFLAHVTGGFVEPDRDGASGLGVGSVRLAATFFDMSRACTRRDAPLMSIVMIVSLAPA
jgi:hypothetical protein